MHIKHQIFIHTSLHGKWAKNFFLSYQEFSIHPYCRFLSLLNGKKCFSKPLSTPKANVLERRKHFIEMLTSMPIHTAASPHISFYTKPIS